jgi:2-iminoacetate synthase ThiH
MAYDQSPQDNQGSAAKDPKDWTTGDEDATPAQLSYISTMAVEAGEETPTELTKAEASEKITELQEKTGRDSSSERP